MRGQPGAATFREVLAIGEFRALWLAELQSVAGDQLARVALSVLVFDRTGSAVLTALTYALTQLPHLISGPLLSGLADRFPRRRVMVACDLARAGLVFLMAVPSLPLFGVAGLLFVMQLLAGPFSAAQAATLPDVLPGDRYVVGNAIRHMTMQLGMVVGFAGGGAVVAMVGTGAALRLDAATFVLSALLIGLGVGERPVPGSARAPRSTLARMRAGVGVILTDDRLRSLVGLAWLAGFVVVPESLAVPYAAEIAAGPAAIGLLLAAHPAGLVAGSFAIRWLDPPRRLELLAPMAVAAMIPLVAFGFRPGLMSAIGLLMLSGLCGAYQITASATFMRTVPDEQRGQAFGLAGSGLVAVQGLGCAAGGLLALAFGSAALAIALAGAAGLPVGLLAARGWYRSTRNGLVADRDDSNAKSVN